MYPVTTSFITALQAPQINSSISVTCSDGSSLSVVDGSVSMDSRRDITRTCDLDIQPTSTQSANDLYNLVMTPGLEITVKRGILVDGSVEWVPLGVFSTDSADYSKAVSGTVHWSGSDRSKRINRSKFVDPYQITAGTTLATAATTLLQSRNSSTQVNFSNVTETIGASITYDAGESSNPWANARELFAAYGYDLNFNGLGVACAVAIPDPATTATVFDFGSGSTNIVTGGDIQGTLEETFNGVVATGEGTNIDPPIRVVVWDTDPGSPTYYQNGFGLSPLFYSSPLLTDLTTAQSAAQSLLAKLKGRSDQFSWPSIVNPALEPLDVVSVTIGGQTNRLVIDSLTIPLKPTDAMSAVARLTSTL